MGEPHVQGVHGQVGLEALQWDCGAAALGPGAGGTDGC